MDKETTLLLKRDFLNPLGHEDSGIMESTVSYDEFFITSSVSIWDCGKKIALEFSIYNIQDAKERAQKIHTMIQHLRAVQTALGEAVTMAHKAGMFDDVPVEEEDSCTCDEEEDEYYWI